MEPFRKLLRPEEIRPYGSLWNRGWRLVMSALCAFALIMLFFLIVVISVLLMGVIALGSVGAFQIQVVGVGPELTEETSGRVRAAIETVLRKEGYVLEGLAMRTVPDSELSMLLPALPRPSVPGAGD